mmetsp:Transcript_35230/g.56316  ORF Transcript_35230/g.56316 Transcript_35230/m.56316 type:complete len:211 (-) Transcript_35230:676-1308(-)
MPIKFRPARRIGNACACIGMGASHLFSSRAFFTQVGRHCNSENDRKGIGVEPGDADSNSTVIFSASLLLEASARSEDAYVPKKSRWTCERCIFVQSTAIFLAGAGGCCQEDEPEALLTCWAAACARAIDSDSVEASRTPCVLPDFERDRWRPLDLDLRRPRDRDRLRRSLERDLDLLRSRERDRDLLRSRERDRDFRRSRELDRDFFLRS